MRREVAAHWFEDEQLQPLNLKVASCSLDTSPRNGGNDN
jgi:hypothetical protein